MAKVKKMVEVETEEEIVVPATISETNSTERPELTEQHRLMVEKGLADQKIAQSRK
jgi:hypothetical protein